MSIAAIVRALVQAGASPEMILAAVEAAEGSQMDALAKRRQSDAERQRRHRANVTSRYVTVTECDTPAPPEMVPLAPFPDPIPNPPLNPPTPHPVRRSRRTYPEYFSRFWDAYPRRDGANPKKPAEDRFSRIVAGGVDPEAIITAARRLAASMAGKDAKFVPQAVTWLNQRRWEDEAPEATGPPAESVPAFETQEEALDWWRQQQGAA